MSREYDLYLEQHRGNVAKGFYWIRENLPELLIDMPGVDYEHQICFSHDRSKDNKVEYIPEEPLPYGCPSDQWDFNSYLKIDWSLEEGEAE